MSYGGPPRKPGEFATCAVYLRLSSEETRKKLENHAADDNRANKSEPNDRPTDKDSN